MTTILHVNVEKASCKAYEEKVKAVFKDLSRTRDIRLVMVFYNGDELEITRREGGKITYDVLCDMLKIAKS